MAYGRRPAKGMFFATILLSGFASVSILAQDQKNASKPPTNTAVPPSSQSSGNPAPGATAQPPGSDAKANDYIPCLLEPAQLARLHGQAPPKYLNKAGAQDVMQAVSVVLTGLVTKKTISDDTSQKLSAALTANSLMGSDVTQAGDKVRSTVGTVLDQQQKSDTMLSTGSNKTDAADAIIQAAIDALNKNFQAPPDVACSMSLLTYKETNDIFGIRIAKDYVAVQVVVRNLNEQDEYLLHDVQLAVDTDPCGSFNQFNSGRDRLLVRAVALRNQFTDPRNFTVRIVEGVGVVASAAVGFASHDYALGLAVYNSLAPAGKAIFPDYTVDQLNRISDLSFTSSGQTRTVVNKDGSVMFVTFFPSKPLEQAWWINGAGAVPAKPSDVCDAETGAATRERFKSQSKDDAAIYAPKAVPYKDWKPNSLLEFRRHTFVAVAGVHIAQEDDLKPVIDDLTCPETNGFLDLNKTLAPTTGTSGDASAAPATGTTPAPAPTSFVCNLKGKNLGTVTRLRLRNERESADTIVADGDVKPAGGDPTQGTVTFSVSDIKKLTGTTYIVQWMDKTNVPNTTELVKKVPPVLSKVVSPTGPLVMATVVDDGRIVLVGANLEIVTEVQLSSSAVQPTWKILANDGKTLTISYKNTDFTHVTAGAYSLVLLMDGKSLPAPIPTVTLTLQ